MSSLDLTRLTPADAIAALGSYPRRYRQALAPVREDEAIARIATTPGPNGRSALTVASHTVDTWNVLIEALRTIHLHDDPTLRIATTAPVSSVDQVSPEALETTLDLISDCATTLTDLAGRLSGKAWERSARVDDGSTTTATDVLKDAVMAGHEGLKEINSILTAVRSAG